MSKKTVVFDDRGRRSFNRTAGEKGGGRRKVTRPKKDPIKDFIGKVDYEGGLLPALFGYGLEPAAFDLPEPDGVRFLDLVFELRPKIEELDRIFKRWSEKYLPGEDLEDNC